VNLKEYLSGVGPIPKHLETWTRASCTRTGSSVLGGFKEGKSDVDFLIAPCVSQERYAGYLCYNKDEIYKDEDFRSFYVKTEEGTIFNLLFFWTEEAYRKYVWATSEMLKDERDFSDKELRVEMFEYLKSMWEELYQ
jgi:hypothetical protein